MLTAIRTTGPTVSPITLEEARSQSRVDHTNEDPDVQFYIDAATAYFESILGRVLVTQSWQQSYPQFTDPIALPLDLQPVQSVTAINYYDADGITQLLSDTRYRLVQTQAGPRIERTTTESWPATAARDDAVGVEFVAGEPPNSVAATIRQAMRLLVAHWYAQREATGAANLSEIPYAVTALLINHARIAFG